MSETISSIPTSDEQLANGKRLLMKGELDLAIEAFEIALRMKCVY